MPAGPNDLTTLAQAYAWLGITPGTDDTNLQLAITAYSQLIADWCSRNFVVGNYDDFYDGRGETRIMVRQHPIISVTSLTIDGIAIPAVSPGSLPFGYRFNGRLLSLIGGQRFTRGYQNVELVYQAGFATPPVDLQMACLEWMKASYLLRDQASGLVSHRAGDTEERFAPGGAVTNLGRNEAAPMPANVYAVLSQYRDPLPV